MAKKQDEPEVTSDLSELSWFESVLTASHDHFERTPEQYRPSWYREYERNEKPAS